MKVKIDFCMFPTKFSWSDDNPPPPSYLIYFQLPLMWSEERQMPDTQLKRIWFGQDNTFRIYDATVQILLPSDRELLNGSPIRYKVSCVGSSESHRKRANMCRLHASIQWKQQWYMYGDSSKILLSNKPRFSHHCFPFQYFLIFTYLRSFPLSSVNIYYCIHLMYIGRRCGKFLDLT